MVVNMSWPETLPQQFEKDGFQDAFADNRYATQPDLGPALIRSRFSSMPRKVRGSMKMTKAQLTTLRKFWKIDTLDGKLPFLFPDPVFGNYGRKNWIPNSSYAGAAAGIDANPGSFPTGWSGTGVQNGISKRCAGIGMEGEFQYVDVQFSGTPTGTGTTNYAEILFTPSPYIPAKEGDIWTFSQYFRMVFGSKVNLTRLYTYIHQLPSNTSTAKDLLPGLTSSELIYQRTYSASPPMVAGTTSTNCRVRIYGTVGMFIDITLRIAGLQMEKSNVPITPTPFILTPNDSFPISRFSANGAPPQPMFLGGDTWAVNMELEIFEI